MKPFDLKAAKAGKPIIGRNGRKVTFITFIPNAPPGQQLVVLIEGRPGVLGEVVLLHNHGRYYQNPSLDSNMDVFMDEEEVTVYFNEYTTGYGPVHPHEDHCRSARETNRNFLKCHAVVIKK